MCADNEQRIRELEDENEFLREENERLMASNARGCSLEEMATMVAQKVMEQLHPLMAVSAIPYTATYPTYPTYTTGGMTVSSNTTSNPDDLVMTATGQSMIRSRHLYDAFDHARMQVAIAEKQKMVNDMVKHMPSLMAKEEDNA